MFDSQMLAIEPLRATSKLSSRSCVMRLSVSAGRSPRPRRDCGQDRAAGAAPQTCSDRRASSATPLRQRRYLDNRWWPEHDGMALFDCRAVPVTRYRYRGTRIATRWSATTNVG